MAFTTNLYMWKSETHPPPILVGNKAACHLS